MRRLDQGRAIWLERISSGLALFFLALLPRVWNLSAFMTPDARRWLDRSVDLLVGLLTRDWALTYSPGNPTLILPKWFGLIGIVVRYGLHRLGWRAWRDPALAASTSLEAFLQAIKAQPDNPLDVLPFARLPIALVSALSILAVYYLARRLWGSQVALLAGLLLALDPFYIAHSRVLHTDALTTVFMSLTVLTLMVGLEMGLPLRWAAISGGLGGLALSGFLAGLALQTHPTVLMFSPGMLVWFLGQRDLRKRLKQPWPYLAVALVLLTYSNMIWHNAHGRLHSLAGLQRRTDQYSGSLLWSDYVANLRDLTIQLPSMMSGAVETSNPLGMTFGPWPLIGYGVLLLTGLLYASRKGHSLPMAVIIPAVIISPYPNKDYSLPFTSRYAFPFLQVGYIAIAILLADILGATAKGWSFPLALGLAVPPVTWPKTLLKRIPFTAALLVCLALPFYPLGPLFAYYQECMENGKSNQLLLSIVMELRQVQNSDVPIYLDYGLKNVSHAVGSRASRALAYLLTLDGTRFEVIRLSETETSHVTTDHIGWWDYPIRIIEPSDPQLPSQAMLVLTAQNYRTLQQVFDLSPMILAESEVPYSQGSYGLYRLSGRRQAISRR